MGFDSYNMYDILQSYDELEKEKEEESKQVKNTEKLHDRGGSSNSGNTNQNTSSSSVNMSDRSADNASVQAEIRAAVSDTDSERQKALDRLRELEQHKDNEFGGEYQTDGLTIRERLAGQISNAINVKNAQKVILISNRENVRKGLSRENGTLRSAMRGQMSTVTIPTQLLRYVQQEIGGLSSRATQNDVLTGFLYWYFGKPDDISFGSEESAQKIAEIIDNLDVNASPARAGRANLNATNSLLDRLDVLSEQISLIGTLMTSSAQDSITLKTKSDKLYLAMCYNILSLTAFAPPIQPGETPGDLDLLAGGMAWDLMSAIDNAFDYFRTTNGREIYKSRVRKRVDKFAQTAASIRQEQSVDYTGNGDPLYPEQKYMQSEARQDDDYDGGTKDISSYMRSDYDDGEVIDLTGGDPDGYGDEDDYGDFDYYDEDAFADANDFVIKDEDGERFDTEYENKTDKLMRMRNSRK